MKVLISGINGQMGSYLAELYVSKGWDVHGTVRQRSDLSFLRNVKDDIVLHTQDIRDPHGTLDLVARVKPDVIHHLAAISYVAYSWGSPVDTFSTNVLGTINLLEAVKRLPGVTVHFASSSEVYGAVPKEETPITEGTRIYPASPYGVSKLTGDLLCQQYARSYSMRTVILRAFNHTSPRRGSQFVTKQIVTQALEIKKGIRDYFDLGNLESVRDYSDARDIAEGYYLAVTEANLKYGEPYNVCSEKGTSVRELVETVSELSGIDPKLIIMRQDPARIRPSDAPILVGTCKKFREVTGWKPRYSLRDTLKWMLEEVKV